MRTAGKEARPIIQRAAASPFPTLRGAAAAALGAMGPEPEDTPLLVDLLEDPVPAVRFNAGRALGASSDPDLELLRGRLSAAEELRPGAVEASYDEEPELEPRKLGVPLPAGAEQLRFASAPKAGVYAYVTTATPADVLKALRSKGGSAPVPVADLESAEQDEDAPMQMPSAEDMAAMMAFAQRMMEQAEKAEKEGQSMEEQIAALSETIGGGPLTNERLHDLYDHPDVFGDPQVVRLPLAGSAEKAVVVVFRDLAVGGTGLVVHRPPLGK